MLIEMRLFAVKNNEHSDGNIGNNCVFKPNKNYVWISNDQVNKFDLHKLIFV